ncbi:MAG TPA: hypothetical protein VK970_17240 [Candidatus Methylacidiphilales bacterium]|nr:hypothetical protein [Candidatus Methylacidiphilales bacterium]
MRNKLPKIVIVGAGSLFFGRKAVWAANNLPGLKGCTLTLVDTDPVHLDKMVRLGKMAAESSGSGTIVEGFTNYKEALPGADFVVLSFSERNAHYRRIDCQIAEKYGVRMCSGDTIGSGGVFRTIREFHKILDICHEVEKICPDAWVINYINPSAIMGIGVMKYSKVKSFALCDSHHMPWKKESYLKLIGEEVSQINNFDMRIAGVNHFTWLLKAELNGVNVLPRIQAAFVQHSKDEKDQGHSKARFNNFVTAQLGELFGAIPTCTGHTKEYVPYYQGRAVVPEAIPPLTIFDSTQREEETARFWRDTDAWLSGERTMADFHAKEKTDHATDIIHTMVIEDGRTYFINRANTEATDGSGRPVGNLPDDAFLEMECKLDRNGPKPLPVGDFPLGLRAQQFLILDIHELTIEAIMKKDRGLLLRALAMDPIVNSIATADAIIEEVFEAEKEMLPSWVQKPKVSEAKLEIPQGDLQPAGKSLVPQLF